jgi:glycosyltransferase involved in cell wall biosynthesis
MAPPLVSVVIPTYQRPGLVQRAVRSVLEQTVHDLEAIVVVDGRDEETSRALEAIADPRVVIHVPERHLGNAGARNAGVALARAHWVAFLDDDDAWLPPKLERQLPVAQATTGALPIVSCRVLVRRGASRAVWPRRLPRDGEDWSEYFFCRRTPFTGEGMITMTSILTARRLLAEVPFAALPRHVDPDWVMRAARRPDVVVRFVEDPDPLVEWYMDIDRPRIWTRPDWQASLAWCRDNRALFSRRGYAAFVLHVAGSSAAAQHAWSAFPLLLWEAFREGRPALVDVASHVANFALPAAVQRRVAEWYGRRAAARAGNAAA